MNKNIFETVNYYRNKEGATDLHALSKDLGVSIRPIPLEDAISGMIEKIDSGSYIIKVNSSHSNERQRFTIAHELGHYVLHRDKLGQGIGENKAYRSIDIGKYYNTEIGAKEETEANKFAAAILMPPERIKRLREQGIDSVEDLARYFKVSQNAMRVMLQRISG